MPGGDRTGPSGFGPMTGRGAGYCAGYTVPGYMNPCGITGYQRWGRGGGRGWRHWYYATGLPGWARASMGLPAWGFHPFPYGYPSNVPIGVYPSAPQEQELEYLKSHAEYLKNAMEDIKKRIEELEASQKEK